MVSSVGPFLRSSFTMGFWVGLDVDFSFFFGKLLVFGLFSIALHVSLLLYFFSPGGCSRIKIIYIFFHF